MIGLHWQVVTQLAVSVFSFEVNWICMVVGKGAVSILVIHHTLSLLVHIIHFLLGIRLLTNVLLLRNRSSIILLKIHVNLFILFRLNLTWTASLATIIFVEFKVIRVIDWSWCILSVDNVSATCWIPWAIGLVKHILIIDHLSVCSFVSHHHSYIVLSV